MIRLRRRAACTFVLVLSTPVAGCGAVGASVQAGYLQMELDGTLGLTVGEGRVEGLEADEFGLGSARGAPWLRAEAELASHTVSASTFVFDDEGTGRLSDDFGGIGSDSPVHTDLQVTNVQVAYTYDFGLGPVTIAPGVGVDVFDLRFAARSVPTGPASVTVTESIDELIAVPMLFLRAGVDVGIVGVRGSVGWLETPDIDGNQGRFVDAELGAEVSVSPFVHVFAAYRWIDVDAEGQTENDDAIDAFEIDLRLRGFTVGGGVSF